MNKQFTLLSRLLLVLFIFGSTFVYAQQSIYLVADFENLQVNSDIKAYSYEDIWIWQEDWTPEQAYTADLEPGLGGCPTGENYGQFIAKVNSYIGYNYVWENANKDLSEVTEDWFFHCAVKTNITGGIVLTLKGANDSEAAITIDETLMPLAVRDNETWYDIEVPMYEFFDKKLDYTQPITGTIAHLLILAPGTTPYQSMFAMDNVYFTGKSTSGIKSEKQELDYIINGDILSLPAGTEAVLFDAQGKVVMNICETASLSSLQKGLYILRSDNKIAKILR